MLYLAAFIECSLILNSLEVVDLEPLCFKIKNLNKVYKNVKKDDTVALKDINLEVRKGEFLSIIGPSGCGKSTLLKIIGNLEKFSSGAIEWNDGFKGKNNIGFVFQDPVLLPWKNVLENARFPLDVMKNATKENLEHLDDLLSLAGLQDFKNSLPRELSGGMRQRVSIVRALSYNAPVLLMDEPFGALDALTRDTLNMELLKIWSRTNKTIIFVTHGIDEAVFLSDRVAVMTSRPGQISEVIDIDIERPRTQEIRNSQKFSDYTKYLREVLR